MFLGYPGSSGPVCSLQYTSCPWFGMAEVLSEANKLHCQVNGLYLRRMSWKVRATGVNYHCIQWVMLPYTVPWDGNINFWILDVTKDNLQLFCLWKERRTRPWTHFFSTSASDSCSHPDTQKEGRGEAETVSKESRVLCSSWMLSLYLQLLFHSLDKLQHPRN